jgi:two-component system phosphate regulon sensor histidine kinase PhoR
MELDQTLACLAERARTVLQADSAAVYLLDKTGTYLRGAASSGLPADWGLQESIAVERSFLNREALAGRPAVVTDAQVDQHTMELPHGCSSALCVPLVGMDGPVGTLHVYAKTPRYFDQAEVNLLMPLAELGAVAIAATRELLMLKTLETSKARFIYSATHELRTPVAVAQSLMRGVVKGYAGPLTDKQVHVFDCINRRLDFLEILIRDLVSLAAGKASELVPEEGPLVLHSCVEQVVLLLQPWAEEKGVILTCDPCREELVVWASEEGLERIFTNLVDNALKYTPSGGRVTVSLSRVEGEAQVQVMDNGIGIPSESLPHLFEEFYRAPNARTVEAVGTGLGLTIAKDLAHHYGGRIDVESTLGQGTTFTVTLPLARPGN